MSKRANNRKDSKTKLGDPSGKYPLKLPTVYEQLYLVNRGLIQAAAILEQLREGLEAPAKELLYYGRLIQEARASICENILESLNRVEMAEVTRLSKMREAEERKLQDPDDVYIHVRAQERERKRQGLPPRIRFIGD